jgi:hypothetical protein
MKLTRVQINAIILLVFSISIYAYTGEYMVIYDTISRDGFNTGHSWENSGSLTISPNVSLTIRFTTADREPGELENSGSIFERSSYLYVWFDINNTNILEMNENGTFTSQIVLLAKDSPIYTLNPPNGMTIYTDLEVMKTKLGPTDKVANITLEFDSDFQLFRGKIVVDDYNNLRGFVYYLKYYRSNDPATPKTGAIFGTGQDDETLPRWGLSIIFNFIILVLPQLLNYLIMSKQALKKDIKEIVNSHMLNKEEISEELKEIIEKHNKLLKNNKLE